MLALCITRVYWKERGNDHYQESFDWVYGWNSCREETAEFCTKRYKAKQANQPIMASNNDNNHTSISAVVFLGPSV